MPDNIAAETASKIVDHGARERFIRDLYAIAAFFTARPDIPAPDGMTVHVRTGGDTQEVQRIAQSLDRPEYGLRHGTVAQTDYRLDNTATNVEILISSEHLL